MREEKLKTACVVTIEGLQDSEMEFDQGYSEKMDNTLHDTHTQGGAKVGLQLFI